MEKANGAILRILINDDSAVYGGQQLAGLHAAEALLIKGGEVCFVYFNGNTRLEGLLKTLHLKYPKLELIPCAVKSKRWQGIRLVFEWIDLVRCILLIKRVEPSLVIAIQGDIESGSKFLMASRLAGVRVVSHIPFAHSARIKGAKFAYARDLICDFLYRLPNAYITSLESAANIIQNRSGRTACVVRDYISDIHDTNLRQDKDELRAFLGLPKDKYLAAIVARVQFKHKGQDFIVQVASQQRAELQDIVFVVVGDGPDEEKLKRMVHDGKLDDKFIFIPWCEGIGKMLDAIDLLLMPSVYEGVPLTMLEAMQRKCPILATCRDGMQEVLPKEMLFSSGDQEDFFRKLLSFRNNELPNIAALLDENARIQKDRFSIDRFNDDYYSAVIKLGGFNNQL